MCVRVCVSVASKSMGCLSTGLGSKKRKGSSHAPKSLFVVKVTNAQ